MEGHTTFLVHLPPFGPLSFFNVACNFRTSIGPTSNGLSITNGANNYAWCWAFANVTNRWRSFIIMWRVQGLCIKVKTRWLYYLSQCHINQLLHGIFNFNDVFNFHYLIIFKCGKVDWCLEATLKLNQPSNDHISPNATQYWAKLPQKGAQFQ